MVPPRVGWTAQGGIAHAKIRGKDEEPVFRVDETRIGRRNRCQLRPVVSLQDEDEELGISYGRRDESAPGEEERGVRSHGRRRIQCDRMPRRASQLVVAVGTKRQRPRVVTEDEANVRGPRAFVSYLPDD